MAPHTLYFMKMMSELKGLSSYSRMLGHFLGTTTPPGLVVDYEWVAG
jgi:hypothetical protein